MIWCTSHTNSQEVDLISSSICGFLEFSLDLILGKESYQVNSVNVLCFVLFCPVLHQQNKEIDMLTMDQE